MTVAPINVSFSIEAAKKQDRQPNRRSIEDVLSLPDASSALGLETACPGQRAAITVEPGAITASVQRRLGDSEALGLLRGPTMARGRRPRGSSDRTSLDHRAGAGGRMRQRGGRKDRSLAGMVRRRMAHNSDEKDAETGQHGA